MSMYGPPPRVLAKDPKYRSALTGQLDMGMMSPMLLTVALGLQSKRRRGFGATLLTGGLGLPDVESQRKTLLGA